MPDIFIYVSLFFAVGAAGTYAGGRKHPPEERRARRLKFGVHMVIVYTLVSVLVFWPQHFRWLALLILAAGALELRKVREEGPKTGPKPGALFYLIAFGLYALSGWGFWRMACDWPGPRLIALFIIVFCFDGFSQVGGQVFGRRKLFPIVSPGKTVEGLIVGTLVALLTAWFYVTPEVYKGHFAVAGLYVSAGAVAGDWLASYYKRRHGVKDFSAVIPGHGGILDRFDSWIFAGALGCLM